ncbi:MAG: tripartite tricarboxylate transporter permease [Devosia sp.]
MHRPSRRHAGTSKGGLGPWAAIGSFFGTSPGTEPTITRFIVYAAEKKVARDPSRFGKGAVEGVTSPGSASNAADQTSFVPTLTLGIPGGPTMALMVHRISPGPKLVTNRPGLKCFGRKCSRFEEDATLAQAARGPGGWKGSKRK